MCRNPGINNSENDNIILVYQGISYKEQEVGTTTEATPQPNATSTENASPKLIMSATIRPSLSVVVAPSDIDFKELAAGDNSQKNNLTITNNGACDISVTVDVTDSAGNLYMTGIYINDIIWKSFSQTVSRNESAIASVVLKVPETYEGVGSKEGRLMFWAEKSGN